MYIFKLILNHQIQVNHLSEKSRHNIELCEREIHINDDEFQILKEISQETEYQYKNYYNIMHFDSHPEYVYDKVSNEKLYKLYQYGLDSRFHVAFYYTWVDDSDV